MQYPGEDNVLGKMKFIFPNKYKVYLHDTNSKDLTTLKYRLYSSGCIRLSKPYDLLSIVAENSKYSMEELLEKLESKKTVNIPLKTKIPIHVRYNTVFVNRDGDVEFRRDFYGLDKIQLKTLKQ
jgi:murein L,D-transpeptidase YcbB/YkuD